MEKDKKNKNFTDDLIAKEKAKKKKKFDATHPYRYLPKFIILFFALPVVLSFVLFLLLWNETSQDILSISSHILIFPIWIFSFPLQIIGTITSLINSFFDIYIPISTNFILGFQFLNTDLKNPDIIFHINYFYFYETFTNGLIKLSEEMASYGINKELKGNLFFLYMFCYIQTYLIFLGWTILLENKLFKKNSLDYLKEFEELADDPENEDKIKKIKKSVVKISKKDNKIAIIQFYKKMFEVRDPVFSNILQASFNKYEPKKYDFYEQVRNAFEKNLPNENYNIINFLESKDYSVFGFKKEKTENGYTLGKWEKKELDTYLTNFNFKNKHLALSILISRIRTYRTYDVHNIFQEGSTVLKDEFGLSDLNEESVLKLKRIAKEGYKIFDSKSENSDLLKISIELRYPFYFPYKNIQKLEKIRKKTKEIEADLNLKYFGEDKNMKVYDISEDEINETVLEYFSKDLGNLIDNVLEFHEEFLSTVSSIKEYSHFNDETKLKIDLLIKSMIYINYNPLIFLDDLKALNPTHVKSIYFKEDKPDKEKFNLFLEKFNKEELLLEQKTKHEHIEEYSIFNEINLGYIRMFSLAQDLSGNITDENKIIPFLEEFKNEYLSLGEK